MLVLAGSGFFYLANQQWLGWLILVTVLCLPVLSLLCSLPALFTLKLRLCAPNVLPQGAKAVLELAASCVLPTPVYNCRAEVERAITAQRFRLKMGAPLPTESCGALQIRVTKAWAYDYLGLFRFRLSKIAPCKITVRPEEIPAPELPVSQLRQSVMWKPKPGGGFAENHELRLYRPGDNLNQIHWKLSAKTGKFILREPMVPAGHQALVTLCVAGDGAVLNEKFGRLLGVCRRLLALQIPHEIAAMTASGVVVLPVAEEPELIGAIDKLLEEAPAKEEQEIPISGTWIYHIGGPGHD